MPFFLFHAPKQLGCGQVTPTSLGKRITSNLKLYQSQRAENPQYSKNHNEIHKINKHVVHSKAFATNGGNKLERMIRGKRRLLGYCFRLLFHEQIHESAFGVAAKIVSRKSSFYGGETTWNVSRLADDRSEISNHGFHTPNFWIPPFLGEMILRRVLLSKIKETTSRIEQLSGTKPRKNENR